MPVQTTLLDISHHFGQQSWAMTAAAAQTEPPWLQGVERGRPVLSVFRGNNSAPVVDAIFQMHFPRVTEVVDLTFGKGRFWKWGRELPFKLTGVDIEPVVECIPMDGRHTTFADGAFDVAVIDPPFMHGAPNAGESRRDSYHSNVGIIGDYAGVKNQWEMLRLYVGLCLEARRISRRGVIVKCKDIIECRKYVDNTRRVATVMERAGWTLIDKVIFVPDIVLANDPKWKAQQHFRRQESYFLVGVRA